MQWSPAYHRGWAWCGGLPIHHLALQGQWRCRHWRYREAVHEAGRGRRQYDVEVADQRGVSALCVRRAHVWSSTWLGAFGVNCCRLRHRCTAISPAKSTTAVAALIKDGFKFLSSGLAFVGCSYICVKFWNSSIVDAVISPVSLMTVGPSSIRMKNNSHFSF
jgi:hypothetical protein